jgi:hypothetical protein
MPHIVKWEQCGTYGAYGTCGKFNAYGASETFVARGTYVTHVLYLQMVHTPLDLPTKYKHVLTSRSPQKII